MKIYQIHEYGGCWEDSYDFMVASYLSEEKAITRKKQLEDEEKEAIKCNSCPLYFCPNECDGKLCGTDKCSEYVIGLVKNYCKGYESDGNGKCQNYHFKYDESFFKIEEVEIIE